MHAICDAILGALGEADIGHFFPNTDPRWKGARSRIFLNEAARLVGFRDGRIVNVDATVIAQAPKLFPHVHEMKVNIAAALDRLLMNASASWAGRKALRPWPWPAWICREHTAARSPNSTVLSSLS